jgi:hypothetical protein
MHKYLLGLAAAAVAVSPLPAQDAAAVVKKAIEAHGGADALNKTRIARSKTKGTITSGDQNIEIISSAVYSLPDKFRTEMAAEVRGLKLTILQVVNGKQVKFKRVLGGTERPVEDKQKEEAAQAVLVQDATTLTPLVEGKKYTIKLEKDADVEGKAAAVVLVTGNGLKDLLLFFDKETGRLVKSQRKALDASGTGEVNEESFLSDYKKVDGALLPMRMVVKQNGKKLMDVTVTEVIFLDKVDPEEFSVKD